MGKKTANRAVDKSVACLAELSVIDMQPIITSFSQTNIAAQCWAANGVMDILNKEWGILTSCPIYSMKAAGSACAQKCLSPCVTVYGRIISLCCLFNHVLLGDILKWYTVQDAHHLSGLLPVSK